MLEDEKGNIYPQVDQTECVDCKKCQKVCPSLNPPSFSENPLVVYAGWVKDKTARKYSTSGGISYALSKAFLENGDAFCGAIWTMNGAVHRVSTDIKDIKLYQGSKYSHSDVKNCYEEIKQLLITNKKVLFTGTPCQVAALRKYMGKEYVNLFTVDIICHGVPSRRILRDRIKHIEVEAGKKVKEMRFRDKQPDQLHTCCKYTFEDDTFVLHEYNKDFFFRSFVDNYALRENCFNCQYSKLQRVSDLTIADFWGYTPKSMKFYNFEPGVSIIIVNNNKGEQLIDKIDSDIIFEKRDYRECGNQNMYRPQDKPQNYDLYWRDYNDSAITKVELQEKYLTRPIPLVPSLRYRLSIVSNAFFPKEFMGAIHELLKVLRKVIKSHRKIK